MTTDQQRIGFEGFCTDLLSRVIAREGFWLTPTTRTFLYHWFVSICLTTSRLRFLIRTGQSTTEPKARGSMCNRAA
ncbi:hypothetical protein ASG17_00765 [Brevundimonas sp. Leaf363]|nr:hypothetical protein ASG17_00765 [Brevundimonas sp. Leaf363]